jgi:hypothetical protein
VCLAVTFTFCPGCDTKNVFFLPLLCYIWCQTIVFFFFRFCCIGNVVRSTYTQIRLIKPKFTSIYSRIVGLVNWTTFRVRKAKIYTTNNKLGKVVYHELTNTNEVIRFRFSSLKHCISWRHKPCSSPESLCYWGTLIPNTSQNSSHKGSMKPAT